MNSSATLLLAAPALATALLLVATHRVWLCRRAWVESATFALLCLAAALALASCPPVIARALAPFAALAACGLAAAFAAWRFAPDSGQSGLGWTATVALPPTAAAGLAIAPAHAVLAWFALPPLVHLALLAAPAYLTRRFLS